MPSRPEANGRDGPKVLQVLGRACSRSYSTDCRNDFGWAHQRGRWHVVVMHDTKTGGFVGLVWRRYGPADGDWRVLHRVEAPTPRKAANALAKRVRAGALR